LKIVPLARADAAPSVADFEIAAACVGQSVVSSIVLSLALGSGACMSFAIAAEISDQSSLGAIERLHQAMHDADAKTVDLLLHAHYQGLSLQGQRKTATCSSTRGLGLWATSRN